MIRQSNDLTPQYVAYFTVSVRMITAGGKITDIDEAKTTIERYLYGGFDIAKTGTGREYEDEQSWTHQILVRYEPDANYARGAQAHADIVQTQRDRLSSGLYASTEPVVFERKEA